MASIFTKILDGDIPGTFVYEDDRCAAFMDITPMTDGHVLVIPREEIDHWLDMPEELTSHLMAVAQKIGKAQKKTFSCERVGVMIQGFEVAHVHIHVWPTNSIDDFRLDNKHGSTEAEDIAEAAEKIKAALA
ncbi:HIT family protein [Brevibacterium ravenspurgense]|uniref:HIT family protein n=1 Tax=Brevibacterium ravenspurgense TaxID=479117 RepID=A0A2I1IJJ5_9MICO|nr:HIT family protein [Brevibacterium ravenspurgense]PKY71306.1 HIT family protein [Brevibacterium ravenspurgense]